MRERESGNSGKRFYFVIKESVREFGAEVRELQQRYESWSRGKRVGAEVRELEQR
jgi:chromosome condensin MukBEF MukE localization factor